MAPKPRRLSAEEHALWEKTASDVTRLARAEAVFEPPAPEKTEKPKPRHQAPPKPARPGKPAAAVKPRAEEPAMALDRRQRRALKSGKMPVEAELDMHGMRLREAEAALRDFIETAHARGLGAVKVVTGKGGRGEDAAPGVLRRMTPQWLRAGPLAARIIGFAPAAQGHGGDGALYVRLKKPRRRRA